TGIFEEKIDENRTRIKVAMPNIKEGSVVDIEYQITSDYFWEIPNWIFQEDIPVVYSQMSVEIPEYLFYNRMSKGYYKMTSNTEEGIRKTISVTNGNGKFLNYTCTRETYTMEDIPAFKEEAYIDSKLNYLASIEFELRQTSFPQSFQYNLTNTWNDVCEKLLNSEYFGEQLNNDNYYSQDLAAALADKNSVIEKINAIVDLVKKKVKWNDSYRLFTNKPLKTVYKEGSGNSAEVNLLLISMLKSAGLTTYPVALSTRSHGFIPMGRASIDALNSVLALVINDNKRILVDATSHASCPNILPMEYLNDQGIIVAKDKIDKIQLTPDFLSKENTFSQIEFAQDGKLKLKTSIMRTGNKAVNYREQNWNLDTQKISENIQKSGSLNISDYKINNLTTNLEKPVVESFVIDMSDKASLGDKVIYVNPFISNRYTQNPFKLIDRTYPVNFGYPFDETYTCKIQIPQGYKIEELPKDENVIIEETALFETTYKAFDNEILVSMHLLFPRIIVTTDKYNNLKEMFSKIVQKQSESIVFKKI
ncbi:MAG: hypothetical protein Q8859_01700, partial [Bacteroidota bacterium]|nr:hypothetical protein [Bacteroidota bacterium]